MRDQEKTKRHLIAELEELRQRVRPGPVIVDNGVVAVNAISNDVSEQERAQQALIQSERRLLTLMSNLPGMVYRCKNDLRWTMEFVSDGCISLLGYEAAQMIGPRAVHLGDMIHPDDRQSVWDHVQQAVAERRRYQLEYRVCTARGEQKWVWEQGSPVLSGSGELEALEGFITDVTDRRQAEEALKEAHDELEQRVAERTAELSAANQQLRIFRMFTEASGQGFGMADLNGYITYWNPTLCRFFGEDNPENVVGKHVASYYSKEYFEKRQNEIVPAVVRDGHWHGELVLYSCQGKATPVLQNAFLIRDENRKPLRLAAAVTDITERKRAEEALRASEERYRAVVEDQTEVISRFKADGTFTFVNEVYCRFFGKAARDLLGNRWQTVAVPEDLPMIEKQLSTMSPSDPIVVIENRVFSGLGEVQWMQFVNRGFFDQNGRLTDVQSVGRDVTERKLAQAAMEREQRTLKHMLQASDHERQLIAYEIHDGLAQYLSGAIMQFDVADEQRSQNPTEASKAHDAGMLMVRQSLAEARRLISGVRPPILDESGIVAAVAHLVYEHRGRTGPKIEFQSKVDFGRLAPILENAIYRIAQEGLTNAWKHSNSTKVHLGLMQRGDHVRVTIRDRGVGFDPKTVEEGRFGLEGIRERARLLGGRSLIESTPGKGTRIIVDLPIMLRREDDE